MGRTLLAACAPGCSGSHSAVRCSAAREGRASWRKGVPPDPAPQVSRRREQDHATATEFARLPGASPRHLRLQLRPSPFTPRVVEGLGRALSLSLCIFQPVSCYTFIFTRFPDPWPTPFPRGGRCSPPLEKRCPSCSARAHDVFTTAADVPAALDCATGGAEHAVPLAASGERGPNKGNGHVDAGRVGQVWCLLADHR